MLHIIQGDEDRMIDSVYQEYFEENKPMARSLHDAKETVIERLSRIIADATWDNFKERLDG
jgi:hypothetical protein